MLARALALAGNIEVLAQRDANAESYLNEALEIVRKLDTTEHAALVTGILGDLALVKGRTGHADAAQRLATESLELVKAVHGSQSTQFAIALHQKATALAEVVEGVIVEKGSVISMGVFLGQSTRIFNRATGKISTGRVPAGSVVVAGSLPAADGSHSLYCAVIVKQLDAKTRAKTSVNELLCSF